MNTRRMASAGNWLLDHAGVDEGLAGDLAQRFDATHSAAWYWRQVLLAIVVLWTDTILAHKLLAVRAIGTGWVAWAGFFLIRKSLDQVDQPSIWIETVLALVRYGDWIVIGWVVGRLHRPYQGAMVFAYVAFTLLMSVPAVSAMFVELFGHPSYNPPSPATISLAVMGLIVGGLLARAPSIHTGVRDIQKTDPQARSHPIIR